jgi:hypothetical protein
MNETPLLDAQSIKDSVTANQELRKSWIGVQNALVPLVSYFVPVVKTISAFVKENQGLIRVLAIGAASIVALGVAVFAAGSFIGAAATVISTFATVLSAIFTPLAAVAALLIGAGVAFVKFTDTGREAFSVVSTEFFALLGVAKQTIGGIISAIGEGDFKGAWEIALAGMNVVWQSFRVGMTRGWVTMKDKIVDTFKDMVAEIKKLLLDANAFVLRNDITGYLSGGKSDQQINADRDSGKAQIDSDRAKQKQADREFRDKQVEDARDELKKAQAELDRVAKPKQKADQARRPEDYMYFAGIASRGAFRVTGDQRQFSEGSNAAKEQIKIGAKQITVQQEIRDEIKQFNKNLRLQ